MERFPYKFPNEKAYYKLEPWEQRRFLAFEIIREAEVIEQLMFGKGGPENRGRVAQGRRTSGGEGIRRGAGSGRHN